jgi:hypothetical protein
MGLTTLIKRPGENDVFSMDFAKLLHAGETLVSITSWVVTMPAGATPISVSALAVSGTIAQARISGGADGVTYHCDVTVLTSLGNTREDCGSLLVQNC